MASMTCFRIGYRVGNQSIVDFDQIVDDEVHKVTKIGPITVSDFEAILYVPKKTNRTVAWESFLRSGFNDLNVGYSKSPAALLIVKVPGTGRGRHSRDRYFAFTFGTLGRFLLKADSYKRGYGLRTALNLIYPKMAAEGSRVRAVETRRHGANVLRTVTQASSLSDFETFNVNQFRDLVGKATGVPADTATWGSRVTGGDALSVNLDVKFEDLGKLCRKMDLAHSKTDYQDKFYWIDHIQAVTDPDLVKKLEAEVEAKLRREDVTDLELAPPEIIDWSRVSHFVYPYDHRRGAHGSPILHSDLRLVDYLDGLKRLKLSREHGGSAGTSVAQDRLKSLTLSTLRSSRILAVDGTGNPTYKWSVWNCLVGEVALHGDTYVLDGGDLYLVQKDYVHELNKFIDNIPVAKIRFPKSTPTKSEGAYNISLARSSRDFLLLDKKLVNIRSKTTPIEICDVLTKKGELIHVKRHLGSADLSHLFSQGLVSAELIQSSPEFRLGVSKKIKSIPKGRSGFDRFGASNFNPTNFQVVYAIIEQWRSRSFSEALPFFSKVNLREVTSNLNSRGLTVSLKQIQA